MTEPTDAFPDALPTGTRLGDFVTTGVIGAGGFGTVYLAREESLDRIVAIKEYLPSAIAARGATQAVLPRSQSQRDGFVAGLHSFMREARLQAQFSHPALLEVYRVWEQNGTAYMAMRYYPGTSLREMRKLPEAAGGYDEVQIQAYLLPVCDAVRELHQQNILHRDVSPDNILIMPNGAPVLLDFGAARSVVAGATQSLTTVLKPGYAPIEQYADDGSLEQGPWTDVYGLGAVMYFLAMGTPPPQAVNRMVFDSLKSFDETTRGRYSEGFIAAVKQALAVRPENRLRSVDALCDALGWSLRAPIPPLQTYFAPVADPVVTAEPAPPAAITARPATVAQTSSSVADGAIAKPLAVEPAPEAVTATTRMDRPRRPYWVIVIVLLAAAAAVIALLTRKSDSDSNAGQGAPVTIPATTGSPASLPVKGSASPTSEPAAQGGITEDPAAERQRHQGRKRRLRHATLQLQIADKERRHEDQRQRHHDPAQPAHDAHQRHDAVDIVRHDRTAQHGDLGTGADEERPDQERHQRGEGPDLTREIEDEAADEQQQRQIEQGAVRFDPDAESEARDEIGEQVAAADDGDRQAPALPQPRPDPAPIAYRPPHIRNQLPK